MAVLPILTYPNARLQRKADPVSVFDDELHHFIDDLTETMYAGPGGVGIAAPQVDRAQRIVVVDVRPKLGDDCHGLMVLINPELAAWEGMAVGREGCMSVPDFTAMSFARNAYGCRPRMSWDGSGVTSAKASRPGRSNMKWTISTAFCFSTGWSHGRSICSGAKITGNRRAATLPLCGAAHPPVVVPPFALLVRRKPRSIRRG